MAIESMATTPDEIRRILAAALADSSLSVEIGARDGDTGTATLQAHLKGPSTSHTVNVQLVSKTRIDVLLSGAADNALKRHNEVPTILVVPSYVPDHASRRLLQLGINHVDSHGNVYISLPGLFIHIRRGLKRTVAPRNGVKKDPLLRPAGVQVLFSLFVTTSHNRATQRELAHRAGLSPGAVNRVLREMSSWGYLTRAGRGVQLADYDQALDLFAQAYRSVLWHRLIRERFTSDLEDLRAGLSSLLQSIGDPDPSFSLSGDLGAEALHGGYRGSSVVFHSSVGLRRFAVELKLRPDRDGSIFDMKAFGESGNRWQRGWRLSSGRYRHIAHPVLIYADLIAEASPRGLEIARELRPRALRACTSDDQ